MITPELLAILRCPMDPSNTLLALEQENLVCTRCRVVFPTRAGIPTLLIEEAEMPAGCRGVEQLPCQQSKARETQPAGSA
jgi:uncharacterized protein YbaR (Trm112 family)